jgi:hypothetical protein
MTVLLQLGRKTLLLWPWGDWVDWLAEKLGQRHFLLSNEVKSLELQLSGDGARKNIMDLNELAAEYPEYARKYNTDIFVYTGPIFYSPASDFVDSVIKKLRLAKRVACYISLPQAATLTRHTGLLEPCVPSIRKLFWALLGHANARAP